MNYIIFYKSRQAVCPRCGGLLRTMRSDDIILNCVDCDIVLRGVGFGKAESELEVEEVEIF